jgi:hypothetical protein
MLTCFHSVVGMAGFEPTTSSTPCWRDTGLRYIPKLGYKYNNGDKNKKVFGERAIKI